MNIMKRGRGRPPKLRVDSDEENICAVCCEIFVLKKGKTTYLFDLRRFCALITSGDNHEDIESVKKAVGRPKKLSFASKNGDNNKPLLCEKCFSSVSSVLEKRRALEGIEAEVRKLQKQILEMLRNLQQGIEGFKEEMKKVEEITEVSMQNVDKLDQFFAKVKDDDAMEEKELTGGSLGIKDVIQFREKIFAVVEDLREGLRFKGTLQITSTVASPLQTKETPFEEEEGSLNLSPSLHSSSPSSFYGLEMEAEDDAIDDEWTPAEDIGFANIDEKLSIEVTPKRRPKRSRRRERSAVKTWKAKQEDVDEDEEWAPIEDCDDKTPSIDMTPSRDKNSRRHERKSVNVKKNTSSSGEEDDDDEEYLPVSVAIKIRRKKRKEESVKISSKLAHIDFSGMTNFKKRLITLVIQKSDNDQLQPTTQQKNPDSECSPFDAIDPQRTHFVTYDPTTDTLNLGGIQLIIHTEEESVQCSLCGKSLLHQIAHSQLNRTPHSLLQKIYNHILGFHLKLFSCPHCPATLTTHRNFKTHFLSHLNHFTCDVCGKPLKSSEALRLHKWLHMNDIEKAEAVASQGIQDGLTPIERNALKRRAMDTTKFQCSTCGKGFPRQFSLQQHDLLHLNVRQHICANCGKDFKYQGSLSYHQKYICFPDDSQDKKKVLFRFQCDLCPRRFAYHRRLQVHKQTMHEYLPCNFKCSMCPKAFKTKVFQKNHELTHSDARPYLCRKGCGATFKTVSHRGRHEKKCGLSHDTFKDKI